jgi:O-antigen ligase
MYHIYRWWWLAFVVLYPLIFVPSERSFWGLNYTYHIVITAIFVLGALLFEWFLHPHLRLSDAKHLPRLLWQHKPVLLALLFGIWGVIAAFFTPSPAVALMGSLARNGDGALASFLFSLVFVLVYLQIMRERDLLVRIAIGVAISGVLLSLGAIAEIALGRGLIYAPQAGDLPIVSFPQKGHLAGYLVATFGVAIAIWFRKPSWLFLGTVLLIAFSLGLTYNRAAFLGMALVLLIGVWRAPRQGLVASALVLIAVFAAIQWTQFRGVGGQKELASTSSMEARMLFWKAAVGGILERPVLGWGGGNFDYYWPLFLSAEEQARFLRLEVGAYKMIAYLSAPGTIPVWIVENEKGQRYTQSIVLWKSHNQLLEVALQKGLVGLVLYMALLILSIRAFLQLTPGASGLWAYHVFLLLWFIPFFSEGVVWVLFALAAGEATQTYRSKHPSVPVVKDYRTSI